MPRDMAHEVEETVARIKPLLADKHPFIPGAVLADLTAQWIAGHVMLDDPNGQRLLQDEILTAHMRAIQDLLEFYELRGAD